MHLKTEKKNDIMVINVKEERLDAHNSGELKSEMQKLFEEGNKNILVDLKDVRLSTVRAWGPWFPDSRTPYRTRGT